MLRQRTLKTLIRASGVGLHTGQKVRIALRPALPDTGIVFRRVDLASPVDIPARADLVGETKLSSCLVRDGIKVYTVEHHVIAHGDTVVHEGARAERAAAAHAGAEADQDAEEYELKEQKPTVSCREKRVKGTD